MPRIHVTELFHIWKNQPVEAGDTLCGGEVTATLSMEGLIKRIDSSDSQNGYHVTDKGIAVIDKILKELDRAQVFIDVSVKINAL